MAHSFYQRELFEKELSFATAAPLFCEAADELTRLPENEAAPLCETLLDRMDRIYNDDILLRSYNGYVTFASAKEYSRFLDATRQACGGYERLAEQGLFSLRCKKQAVYLRVMGMGAATKDFKYGMLDSDRKQWDDEIFELESQILQLDPQYTLPSSELSKNQRELVADYWLRHAEEYWARHTALDRMRNRADLYRRTINALGVSMLAIPLLFLLITLFTGVISMELTMIVAGMFVLIGVGASLFDHLCRRAKRAVKDFEYQGVGQLDRMIPPLSGQAKEE